MNVKELKDDFQKAIERFNESNECTILDIRIDLEHIVTTTDKCISKISDLHINVK